MPEATLTGRENNPPLVGFAVLMRMVFAERDLRPLATELAERIEINPLDANAMIDLSTILQMRFQREIALKVQLEALKIKSVYSIPATFQPAKIRLLVIMGACDLLSNTPVECLVENSDIALDMLYIAPDLPFPKWIPEHDVLFVAVSESDENILLLNRLSKILSDWPRPILNAPDRIALLPRDSTCSLLSNIRGVVMPSAKRVSRHQLNQIAANKIQLNEVFDQGKFPIIIRPVGSQAGRGLERFEHSVEIQQYLQVMSENKFYISPFADYRSADGLFRKYRIVLVAGCPYICHLAISSNWMIHYLNAGMTESAEKRTEEASCFASFDSGFAKRHASAFHEIYQRMGLDYLGIDCAETLTGELLVFEVDSNMIVHSFDSEELFPYKQTQMKKVFSAFRKLLIVTGGVI